MCETGRQAEGWGERLLAGSLAVTFGCFLSDISAVKQTRSNLSRATKQNVEIPDWIRLRKNNPF